MWCWWSFIFNILRYCNRFLRVILCPSIGPQVPCVKQFFYEEGARHIIFSEKEIVTVCTLFLTTMYAISCDEVYFVESSLSLLRFHHFEGGEVALPKCEVLRKHIYYLVQVLFATINCSKLEILIVAKLETCYKTLS